MNALMQRYLFRASLFAAILFGIKLFYFQKSLLFIWLIALSIGFILFKSGICFASMYQNILIFREFSMARAVLILLIVSFLGINLIQLFAVSNGSIIPGRFHSFGVHTAVGAFLFGLGMTIAGGCAVGTLQRIGEGFSLFWLVLLGIIIGSTIGTYNYSWWVTTFFSHKPVVLSETIGWMPAWLVTMVVLVGLYLSTFLLEKRDKKENKKCQKEN